MRLDGLLQGNQRFISAEQEARPDRLGEQRRANRRRGGTPRLCHAQVQPDGTRSPQLPRWNRP